MYACKFYYHYYVTFLTFIFKKESQSQPRNNMSVAVKEIEFWPPKLNLLYHKSLFYSFLLIWWLQVWHCWTRFKSTMVSKRCKRLGVFLAPKWHYSHFLFSFLLLPSLLFFILPFLSFAFLSFRLCFFSFLSLSFRFISLLCPFYWLLLMAGTEKVFIEEWGLHTPRILKRYDCGTSKINLTLSNNALARIECMLCFIISFLLSHNSGFY